MWTTQGVLKTAQGSTNRIIFSPERDDQDQCLVLTQWTGQPHAQKTRNVPVKRAVARLGAPLIKDNFPHAPLAILKRGDALGCLRNAGVYTQRRRFLAVRFEYLGSFGAPDCAYFTLGDRAQALQARLCAWYRHPLQAV